MSPPTPTNLQYLSPLVFGGMFLSLLYSSQQPPHKRKTVNLNDYYSLREIPYCPLTPYPFRWTNCTNSKKDYLLKVLTYVFQLLKTFSFTIVKCLNCCFLPAVRTIHNYFFYISYRNYKITTYTEALKLDSVTWCMSTCIVLQRSLTISVVAHSSRWLENCVKNVWKSVGTRKFSGRNSQSIFKGKETKIELLPPPSQKNIFKL